MRKIHYYQLVRQYGKYDAEYVIHEARKDDKNNIQIAAIPFVLVGNHPDEIRDTLKLIAQDIEKHPPVDKAECDIFHDTLWLDDDDIAEPHYDAVDEEILYELGRYDDDTSGNE